MMNLDRLTRGGIAPEKGIARFMGDRELYESVLLAFLDDPTYAQALEAYNARDFRALFTHIHTLKGASGTMDMTDLYGVSCELTEWLRNDDAPDEAAIDAAFSRLSDAYRAACRAITEAREG